MTTGFSEAQHPFLAAGPSRYLDPMGHVAIPRLAEAFGVSGAQFAETAGLTPEAVHRASRLNAPKTQARAREVMEILYRVTEWAGGERQAMAWYRAEPLPAFGDRTAEALVKEGKAAALRDWLDHIATGGFA
ncbi:antitoxin Xre/MbcA/ParS toxin-binding domain-containing protein [Roseococcus sp.]|uniref:antitoxin Xre/MbcA/ParS toxin-binding domain-containing protein n=1 Tax=Roseococcus sp. TaxID=2109646 RepID=UPI003BAABBEB